MENDIQVIDNVDSLVESDQSSDLLGYIQGQQFAPATGEEGVTPDPAVAAESVDPALSTNVTPPATGAVQVQESTTPQPGIDPVEKQRYERAIQDLQSQVGDTRKQMLNVAAEARRREDEQFERSLTTMDESDAAVARAKHEAQRAKEAAEFFRGEYQKVTQTEQQRNQEAGKNLAAYKLAQHLNLPADDVQTLLTAETTTGMLSMAKALQAVRTQSPAAGPVAPVVQNPALVAAGGVVAPAAPAKRAAQRTGDLMGLFAERGYVNVAVT